MFLEQKRLETANVGFNDLKKMCGLFSVSEAMLKKHYNEEFRMRIPPHFTAIGH